MREEVAGQLRQLHDLTGRSMRELARDIHVSSSSLSRYFSGHSVAPWPTVVALCKATGRDPRPLREVWERARARPQTSTAATAAVRNDLPHDVTAFTGRREALAALLDAARHTRMVAIDGMGGVGKSALAVHAAHLLAADFPGGQLYLDLHGFTPGRQRVETAAALRVLLAALGLPPGRIPDGVTERAALWRSELATRRAIVLLDNAADAAHLRDLLPGAGQSFVVITSRRRMVELHDVRPISLDVLPTEEAAELFVASHRYLLGAVLMRRGRLAEAVPELEAARVLMAAEGDAVGESLSLPQLVEIRMYAGDPGAAVELLCQATAVLPPGEVTVRVRVRATLGQALVRLWRYDDAREVVSEVLGTARGLDRQAERMCLDVLGWAALGLGDATTALDLAEQTVALNRATRHPIFEAASLTDVAVALRHLGRAEEASTRHAEAIGILARAGEPYRMVRSLLPYAQACLATGDPDAAARLSRRRWRSPTRRASTI